LFWVKNLLTGRIILPEGDPLELLSKQYVCGLAVLNDHVLIIKKNKCKVFLIAICFVVKND